MVLVFFVVGKRYVGEGRGGERERERDVLGKKKRGFSHFLFPFSFSCFFKAWKKVESSAIKKIMEKSQNFADPKTYLSDVRCLVKVGKSEKGEGKKGLELTVFFSLFLSLSFSLSLFLSLSFSLSRFNPFA